MIQPIVEGHGDVAAVPVLLRRLIVEAGVYGLEIGRPIRRKRSELVREEPLRRSVRLAGLNPACRAILLVLDADRDCPKEIAPMLERWARAEAISIPCSVVMPCREYEAWFLASIESLRGKSGVRENAEHHPDPEAPRGAKGALEKRMRAGLSYSETADQAAFTAQFDLTAAFARCRSFRRLARAFGELATASGFIPSVWPPSGWEHA